MTKYNTRGAAGLRRSAIVERLRIREEWSALKEINNVTEERPVIPKNTRNKNTNRTEKPNPVNEVLRGVVVLVEVGSESKALALRAALSALGASVVPAWNPFVTHLVWTRGGCRKIRAKARALACRLVSPLWVEACAAEGRKLSEKIFPAPTRPSDIPSPATLRRFLKRAEKENIPLHNLLSDSLDSDKRPTRLRLSSDTEHDADKSDDTSHNKSKDTSYDSPDIGTRVNTAPRRPRAVPAVSNKPVKSKRKLFTQKEVLSTDAESDLNETTPEPKKVRPKLTQRQRKDLATAERIAKVLMGTATKTNTVQTNKHTLGTQYNKSLRIVLTDMSSEERKEAWQAVRRLNGKVQRYVDIRTTHIVMGSGREPDQTSPVITPKTTIATKTTKSSATKNPAICNKCHSPSKLLSKLFTTNVTVDDYSQENNVIDKRVLCTCKNNDISGIFRLSDDTYVDDDLVFPVELRCNNNALYPLGNTESDDVLRRHRIGAQSNDMLDRDRENAQSNDILHRHRKNAKSNDILDHDGESAKSNYISRRDTENIQNNDILNPPGINTQSNDILCRNREIVQSTDILNPAGVTRQGNEFLHHNPEIPLSIDILNPAGITGQNNDVLYLDAEIEENNGAIYNMHNVVKNTKPRTLSALLGAARGCRVLRAEWIMDSLRANRWLNHIGYEVQHLKKMSQKARVERLAYDRMGKNYAYNVFSDVRVKISPDAEQKDAVTQLLNLCGAIIVDEDTRIPKNIQNDAQQCKKTQNGPKITFKNLITRTQNLQQDGGRNKFTQNGGRFGAKTQNGQQIQDGGTTTADVDIIVGQGNGEVSSKWVFDSVVAGRMRTTRRYFNKD